jgi:hypothetical protein
VCAGRFSTCVRHFARRGGGLVDALVPVCVLLSRAPRPVRAEF